MLGVEGFTPTTPIDSTLNSDDLHLTAEQKEYIWNERRLNEGMFSYHAYKKGKFSNAC